MKLGLFNLMSFKDNPGGIQGVIKDMRKMVALAEEIGFETAWFAEHHFTNYSLSVSPLMMVAHMAGYTRRIKLGTAVIVLPLYHPMRLAQEIALVDRLTDGRLVLGIGSGYQAYEFDRYGLDVEERNQALLDGWAIISGALTEGKTQSPGYNGEPLQTDFLLNTLQQPLPPLFVTSTNPHILRAFEPWSPTPFVTAGYRGSPRLRQMVSDARHGWAQAGIDVNRPIAVQQYIHVTDSQVQAHQAAERAMFVARMIAALHEKKTATEGAFISAPPFANEPDADEICHNLMIGDPQSVAQRIILEAKETGATHYNCFFQFGDMPIEHALRSLTRFGNEVIPLLERELGRVCS